MIVSSYREGKSFKGGSYEKKMDGGVTYSSSGNGTCRMQFGKQNGAGGDYGRGSCGRNDERGSGPEGGGAGKGRAGAVSFQNRDTAGYGRAGKEI